MKSLYSLFEATSSSKVTKLQNDLKSAVKTRGGTKEALIEYLDAVGTKQPKFTQKGIELGIYRSGYNDGFYIFDWNTQEAWSIMGNFGKTMKDTKHIEGKNKISELKEIYEFGMFVADVYEIDAKTRDFLVKIFF